MCFLLISWSSKYGNYIFQSLNYVGINLKPWFLIKSNYYIVPSPSTTLPCSSKNVRYGVQHMAKTNTITINILITWNNELQFSPLQWSWCFLRRSEKSELFIWPSQNIWTLIKDSTNNVHISKKATKLWRTSKLFLMLLNQLKSFFFLDFIKFWCPS